MHEIFGKKRGRAIGRISEEIVSAALKRCLEAGKIAEFRKVDGHGEDFILTLPDRSAMSLEVKSSSTGRSNHQKRYGKETPVIIIRHNQSAMSMQEREKHIFPAFMRIMNLVDAEMRKHRTEQPADPNTA